MRGGTIDIPTFEKVIGRYVSNSKSDVVIIYDTPLMLSQTVPILARYGPGWRFSVSSELRLVHTSFHIPTHFFIPTNKKYNFLNRCRKRVLESLREEDQTISNGLDPEYERWKPADTHTHFSNC